MYKLIILAILLFPFKIFAQNPVEILLGRTDVEVKEYLSKLKEPYSSNKYVKIESRTSKNGELILGLSVPTLSEANSNFLNIITLFISTADGSEICVTQIISGTDISSYNNLKNIKENFTKDPDKEARWIKPFNDDFIEVADFEKDGTSYKITISLMKR